MKKVVSKYMVFLFILVASFFVSSRLVSADEEQKEVVSYYQAIVKDNDDNYSGFTAVSQYYYKYSKDLSLIKNRQPYRGTGGGKSGYINIEANHNDNLTQLCKEHFTSAAKNLFCNGYDKLNGALFTLKITNYGNVEIILSKDVAISDLRFYYVIANQSNEAQLFCEDGDICENAKIIYASDYNKRNWKTEAQIGETFTFSSSSMGPFEESQGVDGGKIYKGFNIIEHMSPTYLKLANKYGAYVIVGGSVGYLNKTYYLNYNINDEQYWKFSSVGNVYENEELNHEEMASYNMRLCKQNLTEENGCGGVIGTSAAVSSHAILIFNPSTVDDDGKESYTKINNYFTDTIVPILKVVIIMLFLILGTTTIVKIVHASDEPALRRSLISRLIGMFIGAVIIYLILQFYEDIIEIVSGWFS